MNVYLHTIITFVLIRLFLNFCFVLFLKFIYVLLIKKKGIQVRYLFIFLQKDTSNLTWSNVQINTIIEYQEFRSIWVHPQFLVGFELLDF
jgi:hypothetical protein